ncbi:MAG: hypothetical protein QXM31_04625, partial [Candidatus Woesearchaeota archaeon]
HNRPQNISLNKDSIHLFHFINNYSDDPNMSFWIEFDAAPANPALTKDLVVYVIERGHDFTYFQGSDWRNNPQGVSLVETFTRTTPKSHIHSGNSSHYLVTLSADNNGTIGNKRVNVTGDFWVALYSNAPASQGWNLAYRNESLCNTTGLWYTQKQGTWTTTQQSGCPDAHIHLARRNDVVDGLSISVTANYTDGNSTTNTSNFTFEELPNLPPLPTAFTYPQNGTYSGLINITWIPSIDPNGDPVTYNLSLLNADGTFNMTLNTSTSLTYFYWNSATVPDGTYDLMVVACDPSKACSNFTLGGLYYNFTVDNTAPSVTLIAPANGTSSPVNAYNFTFNVTDLSEVTSCILIFNNSVINKITTVYTGGAENNISNHSLPLGAFNWSVNCTDLAGNTGRSGDFELTITALFNISTLIVVKIDDTDPVNASSNLTYRINVSSVGNGTAYNVTLNETYPAQVVYLEAQPAPTTGNNSWSLGDLVQGTNITINVTVFVLNITNGTIINNTANATYNNETGAFLSAYDTEQTTVLNPPVYNFSNISVIKAGNASTVSPGSQLRYTITVSSTGNGTAYNVTVNDTYPAIVVFDSSQPAPVAGTNNTFIVGNLTPGASIAVNITVNVSASAPGGVVFYNLVNVTFNNETGALLGENTSASTTVSSPAPSGGGGGGGRAARSFYSIISRQAPKAPTRQEEPASLSRADAAQEQSSEDSAAGKPGTAGAQSQSAKGTGITGSIARSPSALRRFSVSRIGIEGVSMLLLALAISGIIGTVAVTQYAYYKKPKVVVKLHRENTHSRLVIMLKRENPKK